MYTIKKKRASKKVAVKPDQAGYMQFVANIQSMSDAAFNQFMANMETQARKQATASRH